MQCVDHIFLFEYMFVLVFVEYVMFHNKFLNCYYDQDQQLSEDEELPLGVEAAINEDVFDLEDLEEDDLIQDGAASQASLASSAFLSAIQEVKFLLG
jgi:hypothetical protein